MQIRTNTWHYRLWESAASTREDGKCTIPSETNLCNYMTQVFYGLLCFFFAGVLCITLFVAVMLFIWEGGRVFFTWVTSPTAGADLVAMGSNILSFLASFLMFVGIWGGGAVLVIAPIAAIVWGVLRLFRSDTARLIGAYVKAKKDRICPLITFVAPP